MGACSSRSDVSKTKTKKVNLSKTENIYKLFSQSSPSLRSKYGGTPFRSESQRSIVPNNKSSDDSGECSTIDNISSIVDTGSISSDERYLPSQSISSTSNNSIINPVDPGSLISPMISANNPIINRRIMREITLVSLDLYTYFPLCGCPDLVSELRALTKPVYRFSSVDKFLRRFDQKRIEFLWIIISGAGDVKSVIARIQHLCSIEVIYICNYLYSKSDSSSEPNIGNAGKVHGIYNNIEDLRQRLSVDLQMRDAHLPVVFTALPRCAPERTTYNLNTESAKFLWFQVFIDILLQMRGTEKSIKELVHACRLHYSHDFEQQKQICEFERTYRSSDAAMWYSKDSFVHRLLNQVFRTQHLEGIFLFRTFIADLHAHLKELYMQTFTAMDVPASIRVYRGQTISDAELIMLKENIGHCICVNGFFSTSLDRKVAHVFAKQENSEIHLQSVLFEIDIDTKISSVPFANISTFSRCTEEKEVLFSIGSIFRIQSTLYDEKNVIWTVHLQNCSSADESTNELLRFYKDEFGGRDGSKSILSLGNMLLSMGEYYRAEAFYRLLLDEIPSDDPQIATICTNIGSACSQRGDYKQALFMFDRALKAKPCADAPRMACLYNNIGFVYYAQGKHKRALQYFSSSLDFVPLDPLHVCATYNNIGLIYTSLHELDEAKVCYGNALNEMHRILPCNHPRFAILYNNIASVEFKKGQWEAALNHYRAALDIYTKTLPSEHPNIGITCKNLAIIHKSAGHLQKSLECYQRALDIAIHSLPADHPNIILLRTGIKVVKKQIEEMDKEQEYTLIPT